MVLKIFFYGMLSAIPAALVETGLSDIINSNFLINLSPFSESITNIIIAVISVFLGIALVEELFKYIVVKNKVLDSPECDEPVDIPLYMVIAALGFAAIENILFLARLSLLEDLVTVSIVRFVGATFLHALASGVMGYYIALSFREAAKKQWFFIKGLALATFLHGFYNFSIMKIDYGFSLGGYGINLKYLIPAIVLVITAIFVSLCFKRLKNIASICKIK